MPDAQGRHDENTFTLANLASHGFVLAALDNPFRNGSVSVRAPSDVQQRAPALLSEAHVRRVERGVSTASRFLDALEDLKPNGSRHAWANRLDLRQVGILGYALGGVVAAEATLADLRYAAAASLASTTDGDGRLVSIPYLLMLSDFAMKAMPPATKAMYSAGGDPSQLPEYEHAQHQAALPNSHVIEVANTSREHFSDHLIFPPRLFSGFRALPAYKRVRAIIDAYTVAFFNTYLRSSPHPLMCVRHSPYQEVRFVPGIRAGQQLRGGPGR